MLGALLKALHAHAPGAERPGHKYLRRYPDGKGGWYYVYPGDVDPHRPQLALDLAHPHSTAAHPESKPDKGDKPQQLGLFGHAVAAKPPATVPVKATTGSPRRKADGDNVIDLFSYEARIKAPEQEPVRVAPEDPPQPDVEPAAAPEVVDLTKGQRRDANAEALAIVEAAVLEKRGLSDEERGKVSLYSGEGGVGASLNQFFTRGDIAQALWGVLAKHGLQDGAEVLEPACGAGVFMETAPKGVRVTGVEIDEKVAAVAQALHSHKHAIHAASFEDFTIAREGLPNTQFDAVIGNAPFCTRTGGGIRIHKPGEGSADRYFLDTSLDNVKDGGLVAMIVHSSVMDGYDGGAFRRQMLARAEVLDTWRLPTQAFDHAHAAVVSDVIVLRKRDSRTAAAFLAGGADAMDAVGVYDKAFVDGDWYDEHPERVLGQALSADETGWRKTVTGDAAAIAPAMQTASPLKASPASKRVDFATLTHLAANGHADLAYGVERAMKIADVQPRVGATRVVAGVTYLLIGDPPRWHRLEEAGDVAAIVRQTAAPDLKEAAELADKIGDLLAALNEGDFYKSRFLRRDLAEKVKAWVSLHGLPSEHADLVAMSKVDPGMLRLVGAVQDDGTLSDVLSRDPAAIVPSDKVDRGNLVDVCAHAAARNGGYLALSDVAALWAGAAGKDENTLRQEVLATGQYAIELNGELRHLEDYATGDLWEKRDHEKARLERASADDKPQIARQIAELSKRIDSRWKPLDDVHVTLGSGWIPMHVLAKFLEQPDVYKRAISWSGYASGVKIAVTFEGGMYRMSQEYPNGTRTVDDGTGAPFLNLLNRLRLSDREVDAMDRLQEQYAEWVKSSDFRGELEQVYNRLFFADARKEYSAADLSLPGMNPEMKVNPFLNETVRWAAESGKGIIALDVGLGKTFGGILLARQLKSQGLVKKPVCIVPKSVATNWAEEINAITPGARVLVIGETRTVNKKGDVKVRADDEGERNRKLALMQQNDYDMVLITKPAFERIPLKQDTVEAYERGDFWFQRANSIDAAKGKDGKSVGAEAAEKRLQKLKASYQKEQAGLDYQHAKDRVFWEDLNVDMLMADEAHAYKNLNAAKNRRGESPPKFLGGSAQSKQAKHMKMMARVVREEQKGRVYFLTATPTKNSPLEIYNMLEHIAPEEWEKRGIRNAEEFIDRYCELRKQQVLNKDGEIVDAQVVSGFQNLDELTDLMDRYVRVRTAADVGLKIPKPVEVLELVDMTQEQKRVYAELRADAKEKDEEDPGKLFRLLDSMKKAAQDLELLSPEQYPEWFRNSPKYNRCVQKAAANIAKGRQAQAVAESKGEPYHGHGQLIFIDHNDAHERVKRMLVEAGVPEHEIEVINATETEDSEARQDVGRRFNRGELSVVIGNTATMGEGVNLQKKTTDIHHLDQPWDPGTMRQRNGRAVRQGNPNETVTLHTYLAKASFDGFRHGTLQGKKGWLDKLRSGAARIENEAAAEALQGGDDLLVMLSDNPEAEAAKIKAQRDQKLGDWRAKKAAEAVQAFGKVQIMRERLRSVVAKATENGTLDVPATRDAIAKAERRITLDVERLRKDETLPETIKGLLSQDNLLCLVDAGSGKVFIPGQVVRPADPDKTYMRGHWTIESVNIAKQTMEVRPWHQASKTEVTLDQAATLYATTGETADGEVHEAIEKTVNRDKSHSYEGAYDAFQNIPHKHLDPHADKVRAAYSHDIRQKGKDTYSGHKEVLHLQDGKVRPIQARYVTPDTHLLVPVGADRQHLIAHVTAASRGGQSWDTWDNDALKAISTTFGYAAARRVADEAVEQYPKAIAEAA